MVQRMRVVLTSMVDVKFQQEKNMHSHSLSISTLIWRPPKISFFYVDRGYLQSSISCFNRVISFVMFLFSSWQCTLMHFLGGGGRRLCCLHPHLWPLLFNHTTPCFIIWLFTRFHAVRFMGIAKVYWCCYFSDQLSTDTPSFLRFCFLGYGTPI